LRKKVYVLDTNVYLTNYKSILEFKNHDIVIPLKVLDEIDKHKKRHDIVGNQARNTIRFLDNLRSRGNLIEGVRIAKGKGLISVCAYDPFLLPDDLDSEDSDNQILATVLSIKKEKPHKKVILVSRDINMRVKCDSLDIECQDYSDVRVLEDSSSVHTGIKEILVPDHVIDEIYEENFSSFAGDSYINEICHLISETSNKRTVFIRKTRQNEYIRCKNNLSSWGLVPRNKEQLLSLDLLLDPTVSVVTLIGKAGSGKTLLALAAALEQTLEKNLYDRVIVTKPVQPVGKDIGYLPGTMQEKMDPWIAPIKDNLNFLFKNDKMNLNMSFETGQIEVEAMTYIRGRSITNSFIIVDEVQNMTQHEIKTVLTRVGEGTKIVLTGDIEQIDNVYMDSTTNGLTYVVEKFKNQPFSGHIFLREGERSEVATISADVL
jgi:PhoH-like ATPase